jgi:pyrrolysine biosynthesis protein PylD
MELKEKDVRGVMSRIRVGIVPIRWGQGLIEGFCETTAGILKHLGFNTFVAGQSDISGLAEAYEIKADVVFLSDDNDFIALNTETRQAVHNAVATGNGFAAGLDLMARGLADREVLVLGCGAVGRSSTLALLNYGARVSIYDINPRNSKDLLKALSGTDADRITIEGGLHKALSEHSLVVDATNSSEIIQARDISAQTFIAAPGMPLGLSRDAGIKISHRLLHDPLQIGVATMGMEVVRQISQINRK